MRRVSRVRPSIWRRLAGWFSGLLRPRRRDPDYEATRAEDHRPPPEAAARDSRIPLTVGFANLGSTDFDMQRQKDMQAIAPLFMRSAAPVAGQVPVADVLFVYVTLEPDGTVRGPHRVGIRQVVQGARAKLVVVANDNGLAAVQAAMKLPGARSGPIVFSVNRRGPALARLLQRLFGEMRRGADLHSAWAKLQPAGASASAPDVPSTLMAADTGRLVFPATGNAALGR